MESKPYLTKRVLERAANAAINLASRKARDTVGFVVKAEDGWVVREDQDGKQTRLSKIKRTSPQTKLILD